MSVRLVGQKQTVAERLIEDRHGEQHIDQAFALLRILQVLRNVKVTVLVPELLLMVGSLPGFGKIVA